MKDQAPRYKRLARGRSAGMAALADKVLAIRWRWPAALAFAFVAVLVICFAAAPYVFKSATVEGEIARQVRATTGLDFSSSNPGRFVLLPRPHVVMDQLHVADPAGTLSIDADALDGDVRLLPLVVGRVELTSATLVRPRLTINLDGKPMQPDSLIGRAMRAEELKDEPRRLGIVTLVDGTATIKSRSFPRAPDIEALNVTLDWRDLESPATLTGSLLVRKTAADIAAWVAQPSSLMRGEHSAVAFHVHSAPIDVSANGDLVTATTTGFTGHVSTKAPAMAPLIDLFSPESALLAPFANFFLDSDAAIQVDPAAHTSIDLPKLTLRADGNEFEGTLAFQTGDRPSLSGTLATEQLLLAPFLSNMTDPVDAQRHWSSARIMSKKPQLLDLDLRISATHLRLAPFAIDDAALAVMTRSDRTEVSLVEGKAYGGTTKGRFSVGVTGDDLSLRATGSLADADASTVTWDGFGRQLAAGTVSVTVNLETHGDSMAALMSGLQGWVKGTAVDGEISGIDIGRGLNEMQHNRGAAVLAALHSGRTSFQTLSFGARVTDGVATIDDSAIEGPEAAITVGGGADIGARTFDLQVAATPPTAAPANTPVANLRFDIEGPFDRSTIVPNVPGLPAKVR